MKIQIFGIYDSKAGFYQTTFNVNQKGQAIRIFTDLAHDKTSDIGKHPEDYCLFHLAEYDNEKGTFVNRPSPESVGLAIEFIKPEAQIDLQ